MTSSEKNPSTASGKKPKCVYCGNNPTNHAVSFAFQTVMVPIVPLFQLLAFLHNRVTSRVVAWIFAPYLWTFRKIRIWGVNLDPEKAHTERSLVIWQEAIRRGIPMEQFTIFGKPVEQYRAKVNGRWQYFESIPIPPGFDTASYSWMDDKWLLKKFLAKRGVPVPFGQSVASEKAARKVFADGRPPFIAKPRLGSRGRHTSTFLTDERSTLEGFHIAQKLGLFVVVEEQLFGSVYRGTYVGGEVVGILRGDPARVTGDGTHTIRELIDTKNKAKDPRVKDVVVTPLLISFLERQSLALDTVLPSGKTVDLSEKIGISYGGYAAEMIPVTHPKILHYLKQAGDALRTPVVGFDFIIEDVTKDPDTQRWGIIEANSLPFINLHHFPLEGEPINVAAKVWDLWN